MKNIDLQKPQKLSFITIVISLIDVIKQSWFIIFIGLLNYFKSDAKKNSDKSTGFYITIGGVCIMLILRLNEVLKYFTTSFYVNENNEFCLKTGLLGKKLVIIPSEKIQSFQTNQTLFNKLSNTYKVSIETAGSSVSEVVLIAISLELKDAIHLWLQQSQSQQLIYKSIEVNKDDFDAKITLSFKDFLRLCISENHIKTFFIVLAFFYNKIKDIEDVFKTNTQELIGNAIVPKTNSTFEWVFIVIIVLILTVIVSCVRLLLKYFGFSIRLDKDKMFTQWGLITTQQKTIFFSKIQMLSNSSNAVRRLLKLSILRVYALGENEIKQDTQISLPIADANDLKLIFSYYQNNNIFNKDSFLNINKSYALRYTILFGLPICIMASFSLFFIKKYLSVIPIVWLIYYFIVKTIFQKRFKLFINKDCLTITQGAWGTENILLNWNNVQSVSLRTSPFQRKNNLADVVLHTAGKPIVLHYLSLTQAQFINDFVLYKMESNN